MALAPAFSTTTPDILNSSNRLSVSLPILNTGTAAASSVYVTGITLGSAIRQVPQSLPMFIGTLAVNNAISVNAAFDSASLVVGGRYLLTIRASYQLDSTVLSFTVNRFITVPPVSTSPVSLLQVRVDVNAASGIWSYSLANTAPVGSSEYINSFALDIAAPVSIIGIPAGWQYYSDNSSYILWYAADQQLPYPHHIAPSSTLSGFQIQSPRLNSESTAFAVTGWNHQTDQADLIGTGAVLSPSRVS